MNENLEDYHIQGIIGDFEAGEPLNFLDHVKLMADNKVYLFNNEEDEEYMYLGKMLKSIKEREVGGVLMHGFIIPKDKKEEYLATVRKGVAYSVLSAIGAVFGFEICPLEENPR